jgi:uncharacterized protein (TIGR04141 family)
MANTISLSIYRIRDTIDGKPVTDFKDVLAEPEPLISYELQGDFNFTAKLFVSQPKESLPSWVPFLTPGFGQIKEVDQSVTNSALLIVKVDCEQECYFAIPFGAGRYFLKPSCYVWNYGLRVALNTIYPHGSQGQATSLDRIKSIDSKTVAYNTIYTRKQMNRRTSFDDFGIDIQRDFLQALTGTPIDEQKWGSRLTGASVLHLNKAIQFNQLGDLLIAIEQAYRTTAYLRQFSWIDNVRWVVDVNRIAKLELHVRDLLIGKETHNLGMSAPEIVDWDQLAYFTYSFKTDNRYPDIELKDYIDLLDSERKLAALTVDQLCRTHRLFVYNADDEQLNRWPVFRCLYGEFKLEDKTYLLDGGDFFEISENFLGELDAQINLLEESDLILPPTSNTTSEGEYNEQAAKNSPAFLLLDKETVNIKGKTSPVEICDLLTADGKFVHVKRKLASASLSHLFSQGYVSGDLLQMSQEYREAVLSKIQAREKAWADETNDPSYQGRFSTLNPDGIRPSDYEIVYAIVAKWDGKSLTEALPFFSKVNLRSFAEDLRRMGYKISYKRVQAN